MISNKTTVVFKNKNAEFKLFKVIFHKDGSYFVTAPYHEKTEATVFKVRLDYTKNTQYVDFEKTISPMSLDDPEKLLKLSHHPDGFLQFSGNGIASGKDDLGRPKGIGIYSWKLSEPPRGPAFGISIKGYKDLKLNAESAANTLTIDSNEILLDDAHDSLIIEVHYIPRIFEEFIFVKDRKEFISITHPSGINLMLFVIRPKSTNISNGFLGLRVVGDNLTFGNNKYGYIFSSSTGDVKLDKHGKLLEGTGLFAVYPKIDSFKNLPSLNWES